jgi:hypothetical protein
LTRAGLEPERYRSSTSPRVATKKTTET